MTIAMILESRESQVISCTASESVQTAAGLLAERRIGALPVLAGDEIAGIFSERDLLYSIAREGERALSRTVGEVMTSPPITIAVDTSVLRALSLMTRRRIRHLPVMDGQRMVGFVSIGDLIKFRMDQIESEADQMREYITSA
ncbi:CBS domain-containing protein [Aurantiacibacter xanthus]|uniref:CBS domain-containing protein n=1 Tax=Aurantiacibacter xanthus TaxID=1784712 RepID=A0A3A1PEY0_9SPHN|nr:CBS domain-containing protein [Aurantiacibacter xanthus]RIV92323.1 CBS domain-containing protein [Aurantiacibacter xanthus]